jgi:hypothetical protein
VGFNFVSTTSVPQTIVALNQRVSQHIFDTTLLALSADTKTGKPLAHSLKLMPFGLVEVSQPFHPSLPRKPILAVNGQPRDIL